MNHDESIRATWVDPLRFDAVGNGPPYLPEAQVRVASTDSYDRFDEFVVLVQEYGDVEKAELGAVLAILRAAATLHQTHHWQTRGSSFYGDHLLFERLYNDSLGFIDQIAERAVGSGSRDLVCPKIQMNQVARLVEIWSPDSEPDALGMAIRSLEAEKWIISFVRFASSELNSKGRLSDGTENLLQGIADKHEEFLYLLQQRQGGRVAYTYRR